jgi:hypothetical protein
VVSKQFLERLGSLVAKSLENLIQHKKATILKKWFELAIQDYEADTAKFLRTQKDHFANPVGSNTLKSMTGLLDQLIEGFDHNSVKTHLDPIIRIRAAQAFTPSQATAFVFSLKKVIGATFQKELHDDSIAKAYQALEYEIDQMGLIAFDIYMECKEKIMQIGANETRNRIFSAFERAGLISDPEEGQPKI